MEGRLTDLINIFLDLRLKSFYVVLDTVDLRGYNCCDRILCFLDGFISCFLTIICCNRCPLECVGCSIFSVGEGKVNCLLRQLSFVRGCCESAGSRCSCFSKCFCGSFCSCHGISLKSFHRSESREGKKEEKKKERKKNVQKRIYTQ